MAKRRDMVKRGGFSATLICAGLALAIGAPSAGLALGMLDNDAAGASARGSFASFTPASVDPRLARLVADRSGASGKLLRFTPAGTANQSSRSVTVAVRVDNDTARAISVRSALAAAQDESSSMTVRIASTRYNLGLSRGYENFAKAPDLAKDLSDASIPDLASFRPSPGAKETPSRFNARIALEEAQKTGRAPRTREALGDQTVDVGGSYSVTNNLDVTAGVRYSQDRDRLAPLTSDQQDSQAVYVGTQFRF